MKYEIIAIAVLALGLGIACFLLWRQGRKIRKIADSDDLAWSALTRQGQKLGELEERYRDEIKRLWHDVAVLENHDDEHMEAREEVNRDVDDLYGKLNLMDERMNALEKEFESRVAQHMEDEDEALRKQARTFDSLQNLLDYSMDTAMKGKGNG